MLEHFIVTTNDGVQIKYPLQMTYPTILFHSGKGFSRYSPHNEFMDRDEDDNAFGNRDAYESY